MTYLQNERSNQSTKLTFALPVLRIASHLSWQVVLTVLVALRRLQHFDLAGVPRPWSRLLRADKHIVRLCRATSFTRIMAFTQSLWLGEGNAIAWR